VVHTFPNGEIKTLANRTKDFAFYVIDLGFEYGEDVDRVIEVVKEAGAALLADPLFAPSILEPVEVLGVDDFRDSAVILKVRIKTIPLKQWEVGRELRRRIKRLMDRDGIRIPFPQLQVHFSPGSPEGLPK
jgi:small conductance mechanosensitive channel